MSNYIINPIRIPTNDHSITYEGLTWLLPTSSVIYPVTNAMIMLPNGQVRNSSHIFHFKKWYWKTSTIPSILPQQFNAPILSLVQIYNNIFQHIIFDTIPKMTFVSSFLNKHPEVYVLVMNKLQSDLISLVYPLPKERLIFFNQSISAPIIYVPFFEGDLKMGIVPKNYLRSLGSPVTNTLNVVYIARKTGTTRCVENEKEVLNIIRSKWSNLRIIYPSNDWQQDRKTFYNANIIIGPHGGGMANMIFGATNSIVIEFIPLVEYKIQGKNERPCYFGLAHGLGFKYYAVAPTSFNFDSGSMNVSISSLKNILNKL